MNLKNFRIANDFVGLEANGHYFDLHNNFSFQRLSYEVGIREIVFEWVRREAEWIHPNDPLAIALVFSNVEFFKIKERDFGESYLEDDCLSTIGFVHRSLINELEGYFKNEPDGEVDHLNICFNSGQAMKIVAGSAELRIY